MNNVMFTFSMQGSLIDRAATDKEKTKPQPTYKDVDLINDDVKIAIGDLAKDEFMEILQTDVDVCILVYMDNLFFCTRVYIIIRSLFFMC